MEGKHNMMIARQRATRGQIEKLKEAISSLPTDHDGFCGTLLKDLLQVMKGSLCCYCHECENHFNLEPMESDTLYTEFVEIRNGTICCPECESTAISETVVDFIIEI